MIYGDLRATKMRTKDTFKDWTVSTKYCEFPGDNRDIKIDEFLKYTTRVQTLQEFSKNSYFGGPVFFRKVAYM